MREGGRPAGSARASYGAGDGRVSLGKDGGEAADARYLVRRNDQLPVIDPDAELVLPRKPRVARQAGGRRVVHPDVMHDDAALALLVVAADVGAPGVAGHHDRHAVQLLMARMEDVAGHVQTVAPQ